MNKLLFYTFFTLNFLAFAIYGLDKLLAVITITKPKRLKENFLLFIAIPFASFGAFFAMLIFRHKIRKKKFYILIPLLLFGHSLLIYLYLKRFF